MFLLKTGVRVVRPGKSFLGAGKENIKIVKKKLLLPHPWNNYKIILTEV